MKIILIFISNNKKYVQGEVYALEKDLFAETEGTITIKFGIDSIKITKK